MKKLLTLLLATCFALPVYAEAKQGFKNIPFVTTATLQNGEKLVVNCILKGVNTPPTFGFYVAEITNAASFKGESFNVMKCTIHKNQKSIHIKNPVTLTTAYKFNGQIEEVEGIIEFIDAVPADGYVVDIRNGKGVRDWSLLKCTVK